MLACVAAMCPYGTRDSSHGIVHVMLACVAVMSPVGTSDSSHDIVHAMLALLWVLVIVAMTLVVLEVLVWRQ
jgi:hypothetical protein